MIEAYIEGIFILLITYITIFNIATGHLQRKWSKEFKRKLKKIYFSIWVIPYIIYIYCVWVTPTTKPFLLQHIFGGIIPHLILAIFGYRASIS
ncbi:MAG: hypothetical protein E6942_14900 [Clostridium argentinense]|nr:hypothetical protein [Clostridium argentinense]